MSAAGQPASHASLMDGIYRHQRHIYDLTRKYYLLGRDRMLAGLDVPPGGSVLEIGCGTGRNLVLAARRYPGARLYGLDISAEMLRTAAASLAREGIADRTTLARGDATAFDAAALFERERFDRVFVSYALSMIPNWERAVGQALACLAAEGSLHVVDFGSQERLPRWFGTALRAWLARFHVAPRDTLQAELSHQAASAGMRLTFTPLYRGYAVQAVVRAGPRPIARS
jgi:S-adenosylmethionine-diacylgycerolhomoserine-N-methlytransferase